MAIEHSAFFIARDMLDVKELDQDLIARIARVVELVKKVHPEPQSTLRSTQVIAQIITDWEFSKKEIS